MKGEMMKNEILIQEAKTLSEKLTYMALELAHSHAPKSTKEKYIKFAERAVARFERRVRA